MSHVKEYVTVTSIKLNGQVNEVRYPIVKSVGEEKGEGFKPFVFVEDQKVQIMVAEGILIIELTLNTRTQCPRTGDILYATIGESTLFLKELSLATKAEATPKE
jgi:hypothetical protein